MRKLRTRATSAVLGLTLVVVGSLVACTDMSTGTPSASSASSSSLWDATTIHDISVTVDDSAAYDQMIATYLETGEKTWISASVTIDGATFTNAGLKLKGNSSLRGVTEAQATQSPQSLPWVIRLDKYVPGQSYDDETELVVRANRTATSLNEAVALDLLGLTGLATQQAIHSRFAMNGSDTALRLVIENPNDAWDDAAFDADEGLLYKAEAGGDYSYRGDDPAAYADVFDQEAGADDLAPLIAFLKFINESDDATFAAELPQHLDIDAFATYLAFQDLVANFDDIAGPGNNSYLHYDMATGVMTVVSWDLNLAFGQGLGGGGQSGGGGGQDRPDGPLPGAPGAGGAGPGGGGGGPGAGGPQASNVLADRFLANAEFQARYEEATAELTQTLYGSGAASSALDQWVALLKSQAADLVSADTIDSEAAAIASNFTP